ncbi:MAG: hypothetical protein V3W34_12035 [Phycisphaerae bacterium]
MKKSVVVSVSIGYIAVLGCYAGGGRTFIGTATGGEIRPVVLIGDTAIKELPSVLKVLSADDAAKLAQLKELGKTSNLADIINAGGKDGQKVFEKVAALAEAQGSAEDVRTAANEVLKRLAARK